MNVLIQYVRNKKRVPIGVVAATGKLDIGWSKCNKKDKWNRILGKMIAINRAKNGLRTEIKLKLDKLKEVKRVYDIMTDRAMKYFK